MKEEDVQSEEGKSEEEGEFKYGDEAALHPIRNGLDGNITSLNDIFDRLVATLKYGSTPASRMMGSDGYACLADLDHLTHNKIVIPKLKVS